MSCEDQGFSPISAGCLRWKCQTWERRNGKDVVVHPQFIKQKSPSNASLRDGGPWYWVCPKCNGYYGEVR
jgi:hypothetical protein